MGKFIKYKSISKNIGFSVTLKVINYCLDKCLDDLPFTNYNDSIYFNLNNQRDRVEKFILIIYLYYDISNKNNFNIINN